MRLKVNFVIVEPNSMGRIRWATDLARAISLYPEDIEVRVTHLDTSKLYGFYGNTTGKHIERYWSLWLRRQKITAAENELVHVLAPLPFIPKSFDILGLDDLLPYKQLYLYQMDTPSALLHARNLQSILAAPKIQVLATYVKEELMTMCGRKEEDIYHVPAALDLEKFQIHNTLRDDRTLLYVGDDHPRKNLARMVEAVANLERRTQLVWAGKVIHPQERQRIRNLAKRLRVNLYEVGYVSDENLAKLYNVASLLVYPCIDDGGFGLPQIEAAACGLPCAVSDVPPFEEVLGRFPTFFDPLDVGSITGALREGLGASPDRQALRESVLQYGFPIIGRKMVDVYREVADGKTS